MWPKDQGFDEDLMMASGLFLPVDDPNVVNAKLPFSSLDKFLWARVQYAVMQGGWRLVRAQGLSDGLFH